MVICPLLRFAGIGDQIRTVLDKVQKKQQERFDTPVTVTEGGLGEGNIEPLIGLVHKSPFLKYVSNLHSYTGCREMERQPIPGVRWSISSITIKPEHPRGAAVIVHRSYMNMGGTRKDNAAPDDALRNQGLQHKLLIAVVMGNTISFSMKRLDPMLMRLSGSAVLLKRYRHRAFFWACLNSILIIV